MEIILFNNTELRLKKELLHSIEKVFLLFRKELSKKQVNLIITSSTKIIKLNQQLFKRRTTTDVISINNPVENKLLGDIYICPDVIRANALKFKEDYDIELVRIIIHGILHLLGYDHKELFTKDQGKMFKLQEQLLNKVIKLKK